MCASISFCTSISPKNYRFQSQRALPSCLRARKMLFFSPKMGLMRENIHAVGEHDKKSSWFWYILWKYGSNKKTWLSIILSRSCLQHKLNYRILQEAQGRQFLVEINKYKLRQIIIWGDLETQLSVTRSLPRVSASCPKFTLIFLHQF